jgi:hypothetical protein
MALIVDLEERPNDPEARETRKLVDLALTMCGGMSGEDGIVSSKSGIPDPTPLNKGGDKAWTFIRRARDRCWEQVGLDPRAKTQLPDAREIHLPGIRGRIEDDMLLRARDMQADGWYDAIQGTRNWGSV